MVGPSCTHRLYWQHAVPRNTTRTPDGARRIEGRARRGGACLVPYASAPPSSRAPALHSIHARPAPHSSQQMQGTPVPPESASSSPASPPVAASPKRNEHPAILALMSPSHPRSSSQRVSNTAGELGDSSGADSGEELLPPRRGGEMGFLEMRRELRARGLDDEGDRGALQRRLESEDAALGVE